MTDSALSSGAHGQARTMARLAYQRLRDDIVRGQLKAGSKLKLQALVRHYEIGMSPLREALARLVGDKLVRTEDQRGFWVATLSLAELDDILRVRCVIETEALRLSIKHGDGSWESGVREAFDRVVQIAQYLDDHDPRSSAVIEEWEEADQRFHLALLSACNSPWLLRFQDVLYYQTQRYCQAVLASSQSGYFVHDEYAAIAEATLARNAVRACRLTEDHLVRTCASVRAVLGRMQPDDRA